MAEQDLAQLPNEEHIKRYLSYVATLSGARTVRPIPVNRKQAEYLLCVGAYNKPGDEWVRARELSLVFGQSAATISETISKLEEDGLVERMQSQEDKRDKPIRLTPKGNQLYKRLATLLEESFTDFPLDR